MSYVLAFLAGGIGVVLAGTTLAGYADDSAPRRRRKEVDPLSEAAASSLAELRAPLPPGPALG